MSDSITKAGVIFIIYLFMVVSAYFLISTPIDAILDGLSAADMAAANDEVAALMPNIRTVITIFFALFLALPLTWFIMWIMHREPSFYQRRF